MTEDPALRVPFLLSAKESILPRKDLESWDCWDMFLLNDLSEGERESFQLILMVKLEDVVGGVCENCAGTGWSEF